MPFVVYRVAACLGTVWGCHGCAAALFWGYERGWIRGSQLAVPATRRSPTRCVRRQRLQPASRTGVVMGPG